MRPKGSKYFQFRYTLHGKEKVLQPGVYRKMGLADAKLTAMLSANW
ncbi:Arm DNA-binding domain-containing protein [Nitrosospira sp. NRS527]|nr:Arm DNA-binding domain-containing protein [Nitrosospira sp. NRS527]